MAIFFSFIVRASPSELHFVQLGRGERDKETLKVGISSGVMAGGTQFIGQKLGWIQCFIAGTLVATETGYVTIENIKVGDLVWAHDPETGETALKPVVQTFRNETTEWIHVTVNGERITCTPEHPFYSPVKGWTSAIDLRAGDILVMLNGEYVVVEQVQHELLESPETTYNFEVEDYHTYYVGDEPVLVHNKCKNIYKTDSRAKAIKEGKEFLEEGFTKEGNGYYVSKDRYRSMRFDTTHHDGTPVHINLETWRNQLQRGVRNKLKGNIHIFFE